MSGLLRGQGRALVGDDWRDVQASDRVLIDAGVFHGFATGEQSIEFLSVQSPPILHESTGQLDLDQRPRRRT